MDILSLIDFIKLQYPDRAVEICESMDLLVDSLISLRSDIADSMSIMIKNGENDSIIEYNDHARKVSSFVQKLNDISNSITLNDSGEDTQDNEIDDTLGINYNDKVFVADANIPHTLYEDLRYTKPAGIEIENAHLETYEWKDVFYKCCQYLYDRDQNIFHGFVNDITMQGRSRKYYSYNSDELREPRLINDSNIYVECSGINAIFARNIIIRMLEKYEIPKRNCHIFIRRDLTSAHTNDINSQATVKKLEETDNEIKIGQFAREYFSKYFQSNTTEDEIAQFTDKEWCHSTFGICYPILKKIDIKLPISEQVNYNNEYRRYYVKPVLEIGDSHYIICQEWYPQFKPKLISWIENNTRITSNNVSTKNTVTIETEDISVIGDSLKFNGNYNGIAIPKILFVDILRVISTYDSRPFETGSMAERFKTRITRETRYEKPNHVINNIRKYLEHEGIISLYGESKKGKYIIANEDKLHKLIQKYNPDLGGQVKEDIALNIKEVVVYSYTDKEQIVVTLGNPNDKYAFLHSYCIDKKPGYRFAVRSNEYVIVNFKGKQKKYQYKTIDTSHTNVIVKKSAVLSGVDTDKFKKCIQCGEPVFHGSQYCWEHYKYHHSESK